MTLPRDLQILRSAPDSPAVELGMEWSQEGTVPSGYLDVPELDARTRNAWEQMFRELSFVARTDEGEEIALWRHSPQVTLERAPIVVLDSEGQLECRAATFSDLLVSRAEDVQEVRSWCAAHGIDTAANPEMVRARVRLLPNPNDRCVALQGGDLASLPIRTENPKGVEDLLGMAGADPRVLQFLESVESKDSPLEVQCDRAGRVVTLFLAPESLSKGVQVRGVSLGAPRSVLVPLGSPSKTGKGWFRWDVDDLALHVEVPDQVVSRITLMLGSSLPPHLR